MSGTQYFGYLLIALSAALLAQHWQQWRQPHALLDPSRREFLRRQLQRRIVASALIGVIGAAITLVDRVPRTPAAMSAYLFALLVAGAVVLLIALADWRAARARRDHEQFEILADELRKLESAPQKPQ